ncbi:hypothetical protein MNBD_ALPHA12-669 [hydrothermal vent metagenome]|uniref:Uncharacterized protein n=1 Tax=hydrothermal vent metagenome TaxID=652676 RepID=A0A3B0TZJ5_9ZZZZ
MTGKNIITKEILSANELISGASVYLSYAGHWLPEMQKARVFLESEKDERDRQLVLAENSCRLISLEIVRVKHSKGRIVPYRLRDRIRASGPSSPRLLPQKTRASDHVSL